jgi:hypothetical protein
MILALAGCKGDFSFTKVKIPVPCSGTSSENDPNCIGGGPTSLGAREQSFPLANSGTKKIDLLFIVDDSGSMEPYQQNLANGFAAIADTYFKREDLDICVAAISSSRYLGPMMVVGGTAHSNEASSIGCTQPAGYASWTAAQKLANSNLMISNFRTAVNFGIAGSGKELLGKSMVSFMKNVNTWTNVAGSTGQTAFFRPGSVANISFLSDENNYFRYPNNLTSDYENGAPVAFSEGINDLPPQAGTAVLSGISASVASFFLNPAASVQSTMSSIWHQQIDSRMGIKDHLDAHFRALNPGKALDYSVTSIVAPTPKAFGIPSRAQNLAPLVSLIGRDSILGNIAGTAADYTSLYSTVMQGVVNRTLSFTLDTPVDAGSVGQMRVSVRKANGTSVQLSLSSDFEIGADLRTVILKDTSPLVRAIVLGDQLIVSYAYRLP